jgi:CubicO group peptidase (beta-lactamase class C family)
VPPSNTFDVGTYLDELEASGFEGVVAVREGEDITSRAFGVADRENDLPFDAETVIDIASVTKQFTAAAILRLEMDGRLSVEDTLGEHVPGLPDDTAAITLHQLLTHTSGLPDGFGPDDEPINRDDFLARIVETPLTSTPGHQYEYSNIGYSLLTAVIEFATGEPYESYLRTALFEPAGMLDTGYLLPDWEDHTIAVGYDFLSGDRFGRPNEQPWDVDGPYWNLFGNGGLLSTAADMLRWDQALHDDQVLNAAAKAKYFAPHTPLSPDSSEDVNYGYGWLIFPAPTGTPIITHSGGNHIFFADFMRLVDQDSAVFVATNSDRGDDYRSIMWEVANQLLDGALSDGEDDDDDDNDIDPTNATDANCGFGNVSIDSKDQLEIERLEIETLPDSPAGRTAATLVDLIANGDAAARLDFATNHVTEEFGGDDLTSIADDIAELQEIFADHEVVRMLQQDDHRFQLLMRGPKVELLLSVGFDETDPERVSCLNLA